MPNNDFNNPSTMPPSGLDRADGMGGMPGTPTPEDSILQWIATNYQGEGTFLEEDAASPQFDLGEQGTIRHTFWCDWDGGADGPDSGDGTGTAISWLQSGLIQRGSYFQDSSGNISRVLNSTVERFKGGIARVTITAESSSFGLPPDEFDIQTVEINPDAMKHPRYNLGDYSDSDEIDDDPGSVDYLSDQQKGAVRYAIQAPSLYAAQSAINSIFNGSGIGPGGVISWTTTEQQMAWEIITKNYRGQDTFYLPAFVVTYVSHYVYPQSADFILCPGGYIEDPTDSQSGPSIPYDFWTIDGTDANPKDGSNNILQSVLTAQVGSLWQNGVTYLRKADTLVFDRNFWKLTQTWVGAPTGPSNGAQSYIYWDPDWYAVIPTPLQPLPKTSP
jgi:hypothetical protein